MSLCVNVNVFTTPKNLQRHPLSSNSCGLRQILRRICRILKEWRLFTQRGPENILLQTAAAQSIKNHKIKWFLLLQGPLKLNTAEGLSLLLQDLKLHRAWKHNRVGSLSDLKGCFVDGVLEKKSLIICLIITREARVSVDHRFAPALWLVLWCTAWPVG